VTSNESSGHMSLSGAISMLPNGDWGCARNHILCVEAADGDIVPLVLSIVVVVEDLQYANPSTGQVYSSLSMSLVPIAPGGLSFAKELLCRASKPRN
jgi:hypothetical protein